jgi:hypothetical protein
MADLMLVIGNPAAKIRDIKQRRDRVLGYGIGWDSTEKLIQSVLGLVRHQIEAWLLHNESDLSNTTQSRTMHFAACPWARTGTCLARSAEVDVETAILAAGERAS